MIFLRRLAMNKRFGDRSISLLQDESDGALSAPEMPSIRRDRGKQSYVNPGYYVYVYECYTLPSFCRLKIHF